MSYVQLIVYVNEVHCASYVWQRIVELDNIVSYCYFTINYRFYLFHIIHFEIMISTFQYLHLSRDTSTDVNPGNWDIWTLVLIAISWHVSKRTEIFFKTGFLWKIISLLSIFLLFCFIIFVFENPFVFFHICMISTIGKRNRNEKIGVDNRYRRFNFTTNVTLIIHCRKSCHTGNKKHPNKNVHNWKIESTLYFENNSKCTRNSW